MSFIKKQCSFNFFFLFQNTNKKINISNTFVVQNPQLFFMHLAQYLDNGFAAEIKVLHVAHAKNFIEF